LLLLLCWRLLLHDAGDLVLHGRQLIGQRLLALLLLRPRRCRLALRPRELLLLLLDRRLLLLLLGQVLLVQSLSGRLGILQLLQSGPGKQCLSVQRS
jgi:hypothetical protein